MLGMAMRMDWAPSPPILGIIHTLLGSLFAAGFVILLESQ